MCGHDNEKEDILKEGGSLKNKGLLNEYIKTVCSQIRWKKAHSSITEEISNHVEDQKQAFIKRGQSLEEAEKNAVLEMGDAVSTGQMLDRVHRPSTDWGVVAIVGICILVNFLIQYYMASNSYGGGYLPPNYYLTRFLGVLPVGVGVMILIYFTDYSILGKYPKLIYGAVLAACVVGFKFLPMLNGKFVHVFYFGILLTALYPAIVYSQRNKGGRGIAFCGAVGVITCMVFAAGPSVISVWIFAVSGGVVITAAVKKNMFNVNKKAALLTVWIPVVIVSILPIVLRWSRTKYFFMTNGMESDIGYFPYIVKQILSGAKFIGEGEIPSGIAQSDGTVAAIEGILPYWRDDSILIYLIHKLGWVAAIAGGLLAVCLIARMFKLALKQKSALGCLTALGVSMAVSFQCLIFFASNLGMWLGSTCPLPLLSPGNMSFIVNMMLMGIILSVYRYKSIKKDRTFEAEGENSSMGKNFEVTVGKWQVIIKAADCNQNGRL